MQRILGLLPMFLVSLLAPAKIPVGQAFPVVQIPLLVNGQGLNFNTLKGYLVQSAEDLKTNSTPFL